MTKDKRVFIDPVAGAGIVHDIFHNTKYYNIIQMAVQNIIYNTVLACIIYISIFFSSYQKCSVAVDYLPPPPLFLDSKMNLVPYQIID